MAGFIVLEDGRAYAASNRATDQVERAKQDEVTGEPGWLTASATWSR